VDVCRHVLICVNPTDIRSCLSDCLHDLETTRPNFAKISVCVIMAWSLSDDSEIIVCTSGFVDDIMFARDGEKGQRIIYIYTCRLYNTGTIMLIVTCCV